MRNIFSLHWIVVFSYSFICCIACNPNKSSDSAEDDAKGIKPAFQASADFRTQINKVVDSYLAVKDALVLSDTRKATMEAGKLLKNLQYIQTVDLTPDAKQKWAEHQKNLIRPAEALQAAQKLGEKRMYFEDVSEMLYEAIKDFGTETILYKQYCPMVFNDKGAFWLSAQEEIKNPYSGKSLQSCGKVQEILKFDAN